jgi:hypothetical protein
VYISDHDKCIFSILYNSTYYNGDVRMRCIFVSKYILHCRLTKLSHAKYTLNKKVTVYDYSIGKFVGYLHIPPKERCVYYYGPGSTLPLIVIDMSDLAFFCTIKIQDGFSIQMTIYNSFHDYIGNEIFYTLSYNKTLAFIVPQNFNFETVIPVLHKDVTVLFSSSNMLQT